jgi:hypothetical protein
MLFWCEYFKSVQKNVMNDSSLGNMATRGSGHTFAAFLSAMRMTNGSEYLQYADKWVNTVHTRASKTYPKYSVPIGEGPFQLQFLDRAIASYMQMVEGTHPLKWQKGFQTLWAHAEWNTYYANYCYYWADTTTAASLADTTPGGSGGSYADAMAAISLMAQHRPFVKNLKTAFPSKDMYFSRTAWNGDWMARPTVEWGRLYYNKANLDTTPPVKINDLTGEGYYGGVKLRFALPATAKGYHVVWSYKPIKEGPDTLSYRDTVKYFQAFPGGVFNTSKAAGAIESVTVELPVGDTTFYLAVKTLDSLNNISDLSNVFKIRHNVTVSESGDDVVASTPLLNAYPNPFNPVVKLTLSGIANGSISSYKIFDVSGKVVADLTNAVKKSGLSQRRLTLNWDASGNGSGIYVVRVTSNKGSLVKKLIYTK